LRIVCQRHTLAALSKIRLDDDRPRFHRLDRLEHVRRPVGIAKARIGGALAPRDGRGLRVAIDQRDAHARGARREIVEHGVVRCEDDINVEFDKKPREGAVEFGVADLRQPPT
jgi:hypothetical protein